MKDFESLTIGEIMSLTDEQIEQYAPAVGKKAVQSNLVKIELEAGRRIIKSQIMKLKKISQDLQG